MEKWLKKNTLYKGKILSLVVGDIALNNSTFSREVVLHSDAVGIIPVFGEYIILLKQYRIAVEKYLLEIPGGGIDAREEPIVAASRELEEEIGYRSNKIEALVEFYPSAGYISEKVHLFVAEDLIKTQQNLDIEESFELVKVKLDDIPRMLKDNEIEDSKTVIALQQYLLSK